MNIVTLCRVNPEFQLGCRNLCLKRIFQKQAALLKSSLEFAIREAEWGEDSQSYPFRTLVHLTKRTIFIMKWDTGPSHLYKAFPADGMNNILKVTLENLVALGQSYYFEINFFSQFMQNFSVPGQWVNKWLHRIKYFNSWRKAEKGWGMVGVSHYEKKKIPRSKYVNH